MGPAKSDISAMSVSAPAERQRDGSDSDSDEEWQNVARKRKSPYSPAQSHKRALIRTTSSDSLNANRFSSLDNDLEEELPQQKQKTDDTTETTKTATNKHPADNIQKPPPIIIPHVDNIEGMKKSIEKVVMAQKFAYKTLNDGQIRLMAADVDSYRAIVSRLKSKRIQFHTYQLKNEKAFRIVFKNLHHSTPIIDIKTEIENKGHKVRNIINVRKRLSKEPMPMFFVDLEPNVNNKEIYDIRVINNAIVRVEPMRKFNDVIQCYRCQQFGHTKSYCFKPYRCVKCGLDHSTAFCPKAEDALPRCVNCLEQHPASYKGCKIYQELKHKTYSRLTLPLKSRNTENRSIHFESERYSKNTSGPTIPDQTSYSAVLRNGTDNCNSFQKIETLLNKQIELTNNLLSMMTILINKLCN